MHYESNTETYRIGIFKNGVLNDNGIVTSTFLGINTYSGSFRNGKFTNSGKLYAKDNTSETYFRGNFYNGEKHGSGILIIIENSPSRKTSYEGKWERDMYNDFGIETITENLEDGTQRKTRYVGNWKDNKKHGRGTEYVDGEKVYDGNFDNGIKTD